MPPKKKRKPARSRRATLAERRTLRNRPRFEGQQFPCPICHEPETVQIDARGAPYVACGDCGVQLFIRSDSGADRLESLIHGGPIEPPPVPTPRPVAPRAGKSGGHRSPKTAAHVLSRAAGRDRR